MASYYLPVFLVVVSSLFIVISEGQTSTVPVAPGLSYTFYSTSCPNLESIVRINLLQVLENDTTQAAGLLRLHFHDCFVQVQNIFVNF